jgi:membrane protease subunit HflC
MVAYEESLKSGDTRLVISPDTDFFTYFKDPLGSNK